MLYLWLRFLHIAAIISWMAGLLYIFRLFIYHEQNRGDERVAAIFRVMERRLYRIITFPAMLLAALAATGMLSMNPALLSQTWMQVKLACVVGMILCTLHAGVLLRRFQSSEQPWPSGKRLRILNEVPTLLMLVIIAMVVFRPS